jgi:hypothetical protein
VVASAEATPPSPPPEPRWEVIVSPYVWAQSIDGHVTVHGVKADLDVSFRDILERLDVAFMGVVEVRYDEWRLTADVVWADLSDDSSRQTLTGRVKTNVDVRFIVAEFLAGRRVFSGSASWLPWGRRSDDPRRIDVDLFGGARYWTLKSEIDIRTPGVVLPGRIHTSASSDWVDPVLGTRLRLDLTDRFGLTLRGDIGGFGVGSASELSWQAWGGLGFRLSERWTLWGGYRALGVDRERGDIRAEPVLRGPVLGTSLHFR